MTTSYRKRKSRHILALCLSAFMLTATAVSFASCGDDDDLDDSIVTTTETDTARLSNGSFEFYDDNDGMNLIVTSVTGWSKSTGSSSSGSASTSKTASGIVDTTDEAWKNLTENSPYAHETEAEAEANWDNLTAKDKLEFYDAWEDLDENEDLELTDLDFYDSSKDDFNIEIDDVPDCANPGTHYADDDETKEKNTHVLMLHNSYSDTKGTAQKYTSSTTITVEPGTSAHFSVWVKTEDLTYGNSGETVTGDRGAYIGITHTVGGTTLDQLQVKNIDTSAINPDNENNGWVQYEFYIQGCSYASSTFTVVLGLGQGGGTDKWEYVDGYAFFDDAEVEIISNSAFEKATEGKNYPTATAETYDVNKLYRVDTDEYKDERTYVIDLYKGFDAYSLKDATVNIGLTEQKGYVSAAATDKKVYGDLNLSTANDVAKLLTVDELKTLANSNKYVKKVVQDDFANYKFTDTNVLMLLSADGAAYTAKVQDDEMFTLETDEYMTISFWLKTSDVSGFTGAGVTVIDGSNKTSLSSLDTTSITTVDIDGDDGELQEDIYDGWQQCFLFIENTSEETRTFSLAFTYGPTDIIGTSNSSYYAGYAAFAGFEIYKGMSKTEFSYAETGTYAQSVSLVGTETTSSSSTAFDSAATIPDGQIETGLANLKNYTGVNGGSAYVTTKPLDKETDQVNAYEYAGLVNKDYAANYVEEAQKEGNSSYWLNKLSAFGAVDYTQENWWTDLFGSASQPLLIYNDSSRSYGYFGSSQTISSDSYATVSVKVKVSVGAKAYIYLIDTDNEKKDSTLSIGTPAYTYWYDDDGNVCVSDPSKLTSKSKAEQKANIAFYLDEDTGLYKANPLWSGYKSDMSGKYYANLSNYEKETDSNGNVTGLKLADDYHQYNYDSSKWKNDGNDGLAFYCRDGKTYAYSDYTVEVTDLSTISGLARYDYSTLSDKSMMMEVEPTNGQWVTCTFYIHTGNTEKNYRLEVWSGSRDGDAKSAKDSYVIFDANNMDSIDSTYSDVLDEVVTNAKGSMTDAQFKATSDVRYYTFSFFDSPLFLRYDSTIDTDEIGNAYSEYLSSDYSEGIIYLYYEDYTTLLDAPQFMMFADYSYTEVSVTATSTTDEDEDEDEEETESDTNVWLLISSIIIAIALFVAVIGLAIQKILAKVRRKKARAIASNPAAANAAKRRYSARKTQEKPIEEKPVKKEEPKDENDPYND